MLKIEYYSKEQILHSMAESLVISGLPMRTTNIQEIGKEIKTLEFVLHYMNKGYSQDNLSFRQEGLYNNSLKRARNLANTKMGEGHNSYLKGIQFNIVVTAPLYWLKQYQRYHFTDIISSQSTMHRIITMDLETQCTSQVDKHLIATLQSYISDYKKARENNDKEKAEELWDKITSNTPNGLMLTMGITMNYLQLVSIYNQRKNHKLKEWKEFCGFIESLPYSELITGDK